MSLFSFLRRRSAAYALFAGLMSFGITSTVSAMPDKSDEMIEKADLGPAKGTALPHDLSVDGSADFKALVGEKGMALFFVRSVDWCPFCKKQVMEVSEAMDQFEALGLSVVYVTYDNAAKQAKFVNKSGIKGTFVSDPESTIIDAFGLRNETHQEGDFGYGIPHPAVFIVDPKGVVQAKLFEEDYATNKKSYAKRPAVETIIGTASLALAVADKSMLE